MDEVTNDNVNPTALALVAAFAAGAVASVVVHRVRTHFRTRKYLKENGV